MLPSSIHIVLLASRTCNLAKLERRGTQVTRVLSLNLSCVIFFPFRFFVLFCFLLCSFILLL